ncbi:MAG: hypothetical protein AAGF97_09165 [Planctomycetota bacterium]
MNRFHINFVGSLIVACGVLTVGIAQEAAPPEEADAEVTVAQIEALVDQLRTGTEDQREAAKARLIDIGAASLPHLPPITDQTSESLRLRLLEIRKALEVSPTGDPVTTATASRVTLSGKMTLSAALEALEQQTGNRVNDLREEYGGSMGNPEIETGFNDVPYLEALDMILDRAGLKHSMFSGEATALAIVDRDEGEQPFAGRVDYDGAFRVQPLRIEAIRELGNPNNRVLRLDLMIGWEPRHVPMTLYFDPNRIEAIYDDDSPARFRQQIQAFRIPVQEAVAGLELNLPFELPPRNVKQIKRLQGKVEVSMAGQLRPLEFADLAASEGQTLEAGELTVSLERARRDGPIVDTVLVIRFPSPDHPLSTYRGWVYQTPVGLVDAQGTTFEYVGLETMFQRDDAVALSYKFDVSGPLAGLKLTCEVPASVTNQELDFELKEIPLP